MSEWGNAEMVSVSIRLISPSPSPYRALRANNGNLDEAASDLLELATEKASKARQAQALCNATIYQVFPGGMDIAQSAYPDWLKSHAINSTVAGAAAVQAHTAVGGKVTPTGELDPTRCYSDPLCTVGRGFPPAHPL